MGRPAEWVVYASQVARSSADGHGDEVQGRSLADEPACQIPVRRLWPFGVRSRPPAGAEAVVVHPNASPTAGVMVGAESAAHGPADLADGEAALYNIAPGLLIRLWADGRVTIDSGPGVDVVVNGGAAPVGRVGDDVSATAGMAQWIVDVIAALAALGQVIAPPAGFGTIAVGAPRFRG